MTGEAEAEGGSSPPIMKIPFFIRAFGDRGRKRKKRGKGISAPRSHNPVLLEDRTEEKEEKRGKGSKQMK